jgi:proline iminopeptidase
VVRYAPNIPDNASTESLDAFGALFAGPQPSDDEWRATWNQALPLYWPTIDNFPDLAADIDNRTAYRSAAWNRGSELLGTYNVSGRLSEITVPTLVLGGRNDFITIPQGHIDIDAELPNSELVIFENSGHFPFITEAELYRQTVSDWLASI